MRNSSLLALLRSDRVAFVAAIWLMLVVGIALVGPEVVGKAATGLDLRARNAPPFDFSRGWVHWLGSDALGRGILARIFLAARTTLGIAVASVLLSMVIGGTLGIIAGLSRGSLGKVIMRGTDVIMSFPSLLMALIVLYVLGGAPANLVVVLAITRLPVYVRTARAEVLEIRERAFINAARVMGAGQVHLALRHIAPLVLPTLFIIGSLDFAYVMLAESALSFLGMGVQPPSITWGLMVAEGRSYLNSAWWLSFWPGLFIMLTALSANLLASWFRIAGDPTLRAAQGNTGHA
ncbi:peptide/nickel transport system permease protein [Amaricoccus macauensis]|uniref:Peptide/nickel transport system permease protein n=1 Tax=Amaricoccus macauensis TaxID=57001 RepID=A0A840SC62_9RHOB|nr:ABC transporter permease [Amaricoccus macauensis]MBB5220369.1 peptide/nickel transport system permease protein [Amaricoccus macauensis]